MITCSLPRDEVVRRVLRDDPRQEYFVVVPSSCRPDAPLLVSVHGRARNAADHAEALAALARERGVVLLAPHFSEEQYADYQRLGRDDKRADRALDAVVQEGAWLTGAAASQIYLFGFAGGAQFVHRYVMIQPRRVARAVIVSAGWYTFPDNAQRYPFGMRPARGFRSTAFDPDAFLRVPITVLIPEADGAAHALKRTPRLDTQQGVTRRERARRWCDAMMAAARARGLKPRVNVLTLPGPERSFREAVEEQGIGEVAFDALFDSTGSPVVEQWQET